MKKKQLKKQIKQLKKENVVLQEDYDDMLKDWRKIDNMYTSILIQITSHVSDEVLDMDIQRIRDSRTNNWDEFIKKAAEKAIHKYKECATE